MHPIVIIFLIFIALGAGYFLLNGQSDTVHGYLDTAQSKVGLNHHQLTGIAEIVLTLVVVYFVFNWMRSSSMRRDSNKRFRDEINNPPGPRGR